MESHLCEYMTIQVEEIKKVLENLEEEQAAILDNDRHHMKQVLDERRAMLEMIQRLSERIGREMEEMGISTMDDLTNSRLFGLNLEIDGLMGKIGKWNDRNKTLLQLRVSGC